MLAEGPVDCHMLAALIAAGTLVEAEADLLARVQLEQARSVVVGTPALGEDHKAAPEVGYQIPDLRSAGSCH